MALVFAAAGALGVIAYSILLYFGINIEWLGQGGVMAFVLAFVALVGTTT